MLTITNKPRRFIINTNEKAKATQSAPTATETRKGFFVKPNEIPDGLRNTAKRTVDMGQQVVGEVKDLRNVNLKDTLGAIKSDPMGSARHASGGIVEAATTVGAVALGAAGIIGLGLGAGACVVGLALFDGGRSLGRKIKGNEVIVEQPAKAEVPETPKQEFKA